jgi:hypothetical protein
MENVEGADDEQYERARQRQREDLISTKRLKRSVRRRIRQEVGEGIVQESTHLSWTSVEVPCGGAGVEEEGGAPEHAQKTGKLQ